MDDWEGKKKPNPSSLAVAHTASRHTQPWSASRSRTACAHVALFAAWRSPPPLPPPAAHCSHPPLGLCLVSSAGLRSLANFCLPRAFVPTVVVRTSCDGWRCDWAQWRGAATEEEEARRRPQSTEQPTMRRETQKCWRSSSDQERSAAVDNERSQHWYSGARLCFVRLDPGCPHSLLTSPHRIAPRPLCSILCFHMLGEAAPSGTA